MLLGLPGEILIRVNFDHLKHELSFGGGLKNKFDNLKIIYS
jgi:hypothetical protein